jgi:hypothetical protein
MFYALTSCGLPHCGSTYFIRIPNSDDEVNFTRWMSYPAHLPNLKRLKPKGNTRPDGVANSHYERQKRGELPEIY